MTDEIKCPECKKEMKLLPIQQPLSGTSTEPISFIATPTFTVPSYPTTSKTFKCSNPECWVTKLQLSWS